MSILAITDDADPPRGADVMAAASLLLLASVVDANDDDDEESAVEDVVTWALALVVVDPNAVLEPPRRLLPLAVLRTGLNEYAEPWIAQATVDARANDRGRFSFMILVGCVMLK